VVARTFGLAADPPDNMRIRVPEDVGTNVEAIVVRLDDERRRWWKLVRTFDDPATWTEPFVRHLTATGPDGRRFRVDPIADEWELYDLTDDPTEATNRWGTVDASLRDRPGRRAGRGTCTLHAAAPRRLALRDAPHRVSLA
jgi:hypothetical protein